MINIYHIRFYAFLLGCIGSRSLFTAVSAFASPWLLRMLGYMALLPVMGWFYIIFIGKRDTGLEVFGESIWWKSLRPIHMVLWGLFAYMAIVGLPRAWVVLAVDTVFGLCAFLFHHWREGTLSLMLK